MSLPKIPKAWGWSAEVDACSVTVILTAFDMDNPDRRGVELVRRSVPCGQPDDWESRIDGLAGVIWEDMNAAAKLSADIGIEVVCR